ncbi:CAAX prenyl protease-like protein [Diaminobutyricimonas aerilata]|uniref:CAAX prenyl protease-like protein n=2 Tax=Diaminobutyricimonas aerilata TaxID=1162967 RepID=A0A2M9CLT4_9MICO|nr:CAAX prenyl protease-like protein [Diaminobutyricimonas aerilata]
MATSTDGASGLREALLWCAARVVAVALAVAAATALVAAIGLETAFPPTPLIASLALIPVNLITLWAVRRRVRRDGGTLRTLLGFDRSRLGRDALWAVLWIAVLYVPFCLAVVGTMFALHGADAFDRFETVFVPTVTPGFPTAVAVVLGLVVVATFAPLNAPAEEALFRGVAQGALARAGRPVLAVALPAVAFGVQHLFFAPGPDAMVVYAVAFLFWGIGSGLIAARQRRLMPLVLAHALVNLLTTLPAALLPLLIPEAS